MRWIRSGRSDAVSSLRFGEVRAMSLLMLPGVFRPISDSQMLAQWAAVESSPHASVLDLCTGSGIVALTAAAAGASVDSVDVSRRALANVRLNARLRGLRIATRRGRLFEPIGDRRFDLVTANPPYVPDLRPDVPSRGLERAWAAGMDGRQVLDLICHRVTKHLPPHGTVLLVHSSLIDEHETCRRLRDAGLRDVEVVDRRTGPLGPLMRRAQRDGLVDPALDEEDLVVVRGRASTGSP